MLVFLLLEKCLVLRADNDSFGLGHSTTHLKLQNKVLSSIWTLGGIFNRLSHESNIKRVGWAISRLSYITCFDFVYHSITYWCLKVNLIAHGQMFHHSHGSSCYLCVIDYYLIYNVLQGLEGNLSIISWNSDSTCCLLQFLSLSKSEPLFYFVLYNIKHSLTLV